MLRSNAPFPSPMPSSNLIGFGTSTHMTIKRSYLYASYLFIYYENYTQSRAIKKIRQEIHRSTLNAHWARRKAILSFTEFIRSHAGLGSNSGVFGNGFPIHCINTFPAIARRSKGVYYCHRVIGLLVNICQWASLPFEPHRVLPSVKIHGR